MFLKWSYLRLWQNICPEQVYLDYLVENLYLEEVLLAQYV